jgi:CubicO group peptidase (beta-lactamase class C family)
LKAAGLGVLGLAVAGLRPTPARAGGVAASPDGLDAFVAEQMAELHLPGLAACLVRQDRVLWSSGYGWANIERELPATPDTLFLLASVSKTVTAVAVMQAVEDGLLDLDADVNEVLPFPVRNPHFGRRPITGRMLLTHTSSIEDDGYLLSRLYFHGDAPFALDDFLREYLTPDGRFFSQWVNFGAAPPGTTFRYSNYAVALAGLLVEAATGTPFDGFCRERIFGPLGMTQTSWRVADLDERTLAMPYQYDLEAARFVPWGIYGYPDYPDGLLRTSAAQLARFLMAFIGFGEYRGTRILQPETVAEMRRPQIEDLYPGQGLIWYYQAGPEGTSLLGHDGGDLGVATLMFFEPESEVGVILLDNGEAWPNEVMDRMFRQALGGGAAGGVQPGGHRTRFGERAAPVRARLASG